MEQWNVRNSPPATGDIHLDIEQALSLTFGVSETLYGSCWSSKSPLERWALGTVSIIMCYVRYI